MNYIFLKNQIGSDEVGTGDFFCPIVVAATLIKKKDIDILNILGIKDSKKLSDKKIKEIYEEIKKLKIPYEFFILPNDEYNEIYKEIQNMNAIKSILHNIVINKIYSRYPEIKNIFIDKFTTHFDNHLGNFGKIKSLKFKNLINLNLPKIIHKEKGEEKYPSIATASIVARAEFLNYIYNMRKKYGMNIPLGCCNNVKIFSVDFIKKYGIEEFKKNVKLNFKTYKEILKSF